MRLGPSDASAHYARAVALWGTGRLDAAIGEYETAASLRPRDYVVWQELGRARGQAGEEQGALAALTEAVRLAPFYAQPRWQLAQILLRSGRRDEAFAELRRAVASDPGLFPQAIELAWDACGGDTRAAENVIRPQSDAQRVELARFFAAHGKADEAIRLFRSAGAVSDRERDALLTQLLGAGRFREAYEVWSKGRAGVDGTPGYGISQVVDGGFEKGIFTKQGFGWRVGRDSKAVQVSLEANEARAGEGGGPRSLRVDFSGASNQALPVISQLVLTEPNTGYRLSFAARTEKIVTGGPPVVVISDADPNNGQKVIAQSKALPPGTSEWQNYVVEFATDNSTTAIVINFQRQNCSADPCPAFGRVWLDDFILRRL